MIHETRVRLLNDEAVAAGGKYVLYWMQASQRTRYNHALEYAVRRANGLGQPAVVGFGLSDDYPEANERHYAFMLRGLRDVGAALRRRGVLFLVRHGSPETVAVELARRASLVVCDAGYQRRQKRWRDHVADRAGRSVVQVESDVVVPAEEVSDKAEFAARTIRPKIHRLWDQYLRALKPVRPEYPPPAVNSPGVAPAAKESQPIDAGDVESALAALKIDRSVPPSGRFSGGEIEAGRRLARFVRGGLAGYADRRNEPAARGTSTMAPYLHFGQISPLEIAVRIRRAPAPAADREAYLEELIVRRELAVNFVHYHPHYDAYEGLPAWARKTLREHANDPRAVVYGRAELEGARTYDRYWNAAQREMTGTGFMHNYMRMYWGKRILEWKRTPEEAFADALYLNNKYFLCGRDPNAYANVAWLFGLHDRPWKERPVFGKVRYMNAAGLERKFDMDAYVEWVDAGCQV